MGTIYSVSCRDCKVTRDLDKFYAMRTASDRAEALVIAKDIKERDSYRAALLASFMWEHKGHNCTVFNEHDDALSEELDPFENEHGVKEDRDYWRESPNNVIGGTAYCTSRIPAKSQAAPAKE